MRRRAFLLRLSIALLAFACALPTTAGDAVCPKCGAPLEPGAAFCVRCGFKLAGNAAPTPAAAPDARGAVVQVVTVHDNELTSTFASLAYESKLKIDSILGTAVPVAPGEFITDAGLLVGAKEVTLRTASGRSVSARVVGVDPMIGVALLKADLAEIAPLPLRENEPARLGEALRVVGFSSGSSASGEAILSSGVVSGLHRGARKIHPIEDYIQTDASVPPGFAGGAMLDVQGRVVGMSTGFVFGSEVLLGPQTGIGYAIPADWIGRALTWLRSGAPPRGWIGACTASADSELRARYNLPPEATLVIEEVFPGSPAASVGLRRGDGLVRVQGEGVPSLARLHDRLLTMKPGDPLTLEVARGAELRSVALALTARPERPRLGGIDALRYFGDLDLATRDEDTLVVASVTPGSELAHPKISAGDILQGVLSKKDWVHGAKDNSRWRSVHTVADLETRLETAYSDLDFYLGLRFRSKDGAKRELFLWEILTPTGAL